MIKKSWKVLSKKIAFKNRWRQIDEWRVRVPNGTEKNYYFNINADVVVIVALNKKKQLVLIDQHFIHCGQRVLTLPAGYVEGGSVLAAAKRELREETGYAARAWVKLGSAYIGKWSTNKAHFYLVKDAQKKYEQELEPSEDIDVALKSMEEVKKIVHSKKINDLFLLAGLGMLLLK